MYGTVARLSIKSGMEAEIATFAESWKTTRRPHVEGVVGGYIYRLDAKPGTMIMAMVFKDRASYHANAQDPAQDVEYQRLRALLTEDPVWEDGEVIATL